MTQALAALRAFCVTDRRLANGDIFDIRTIVLDMLGITDHAKAFKFLCTSKSAADYNWREAILASHPHLTRQVMSLYDMLGKAQRANCDDEVLLQIARNGTCDFETHRVFRLLMTANGVPIHRVATIGEPAAKPLVLCSMFVIVLGKYMRKYGGGDSGGGKHVIDDAGGERVGGASGERVGGASASEASASEASASGASCPSASGERASQLTFCEILYRFADTNRTSVLRHVMRWLLTAHDRHDATTEPDVSSIKYLLRCGEYSISERFAILGIRATAHAIDLLADGLDHSVIIARLFECKNFEVLWCMQRANKYGVTLRSIYEACELCPATLQQHMRAVRWDVQSRCAVPTDARGLSFAQFLAACGFVGDASEEERDEIGDNGLTLLAFVIASKCPIGSSTLAKILRKDDLPSLQWMLDEPWCDVSCSGEIWQIVYERVVHELITRSRYIERPPWRGAGRRAWLRGG